jgi:outer membrane immunogenic protein
MPAKAPVYTKAPAMVAAPYNWSGVYIGGNLGGAWNRTSWTWNLPGLFDAASTTNSSSFTGGGQIGWQQQSGNFVGGVEVSYNGGRLGSTSVITDPIGIPRDFSSRIDSFLIAALRLGIASDRWLMYVKGGYAGATLKLNVDRDPAFGFLAQTQSSQWMNGWDVGVGAEYALSANWIAGVEYNYLGFRPGNVSNVQIPPTILSNHTGISSSISTVTGRISYKFGGI